MNFLSSISSLTKQLYPTGRAFKMPAGGWLDSLHNALALSENKALMDAYAILNSILPDNDNFTEDDATDWERRLGLINGTGVALSDRKLAIKRKMNHPGTIKARQHYLYVQGQLQAAGFNVFVTENRFDDGNYGYETQNPITLGGFFGTDFNELADHQLADAQLGGSWNHLVVNSLDNAVDLNFNVGSNLRSTFFIGGPHPGVTGQTYAYVPFVRQKEFRQLILKLKPVQTVAYLFIVYT